jgi:hypothetical protein
MKIEKISTREFRNNIAKYLLGSNPLAIMRHGQTIGYYFPAKPDEEEIEIKTLKLAASRLDVLLKEKGITEDEVVEEFKKMRSEDRGK